MPEVVQMYIADALVHRLTSIINQNGCGKQNNSFMLKQVNKTRKGKNRRTYIYIAASRHVKAMKGKNSCPFPLASHKSINNRRCMMVTQNKVSCHKARGEREKERKKKCNLAIRDQNTCMSVNKQ